MKKNVILIGFMGAGKTSVGYHLAKKLGYRQLDTDELIEKKAGRRIPDIFKQKGEEYFRQLETDMLRELKQTANERVISTGGGLPLREENAALLKEMGFVVYLSISEQAVLERLKGDRKRPLLQGEDPQGAVHRLLEYRKPLYEIAAHMPVEVDNKSFEQIVAEIVRNYRLLVK